MVAPSDRIWHPYCEPWEPWFAWHPIQHDGKYIWLKQVWRQGWVDGSTVRYPSFYMYKTKREYLIYKLKGGMNGNDAR